VSGTATRRADLAEVVLLRVAALLRADSLEEIATLGPDALWHTPDGAATDALALPQPKAAAVVTPAARAAAERDQETTWLDEALDIVREPARDRKHLTIDDR
jgi:hypothetical protein